MYEHLPSYRAMLDREGFAGPENAAIIGVERAVADRIEALKAVGVDEFVGGVIGSSEDCARTRALLRQIDAP